MKLGAPALSCSSRLTSLYESPVFAAQKLWGSQQARGAAGPAPLRSGLLASFSKFVAEETPSDALQQHRPLLQRPPTPGCYEQPRKRTKYCEKQL